MSERPPRSKPKRDHVAAHASAPPRWETVVWVCLLLAGLTFALYFPVAHHDFLNFDDPDYVTKNLRVQAGLTFAGVRWSFGTWHPLTWLSLMTDVELFGAKPGALHLVNLFWHTGNTVLLFLLLRRLTGGLWRSAFIAALFAWHPMQVETVAWIAERKGVLSTFFGLLTLWWYASFVEQSRVKSPKSKVSYTLALVLFALALLSKPMLVTLPCLMLLLDYWPLKRVSPPGHSFNFKLWLPIVREKIPFFLLSALSAAATVFWQKEAGALQTLAGYSAASRIENALVGYAHYLGKTFWPVALATPYPRANHWPMVILTLSFLLTAGLCATALWQVRRRPFVFTGWLWFWGMLIPVIGLIQAGAQSVADRYGYMPLVGLFLLVTWSANEAIARWRLPRLAVGLVATLVLLGCAARTRDQLRHWQNSETLFQHAIAVSRDNFLAHYLLGTYYDSLGRGAEAFQQYRRSAEIKPNYADPWNNMGYRLAGEGDFVQAAACFEAAARARPDVVDFRYNLAKALNRAGKTDEAGEQFRQVLQQKPEFAIAHNDYGLLLLGQRKFDEALAQFQESIRLQPENPLPHFNLGRVFAARGQRAEAIQHFRAALRLRPDFAPARQELQALGATEGN